MSLVLHSAALSAATVLSAGLAPQLGARAPLLLVLVACVLAYGAGVGCRRG